MRPLNLNTHPIIFRVIWGLRKMALLAFLLAALFFCLVEIEYQNERTRNELSEVLSLILAHSDCDGSGQAGSAMPPVSPDARGSGRDDASGDGGSIVDSLAYRQGGRALRGIHGRVDQLLIYSH